MDTAAALMTAASPETLPLMGVATTWLWNGAEDGAAAAHCIDGCMTLHYALAEYGIDSRVEAVMVEVDNGKKSTLYGSEHGPWWHPDGTFNGHAILVVPPADRFMDPTIQQYAEVPDTELATRPVMGRLPAPDGLGENPLALPRTDHLVTYHPMPAQHRDVWGGPAVLNADAQYRQAGANLAANVVAIMQLDHLAAAAAQVPYPRLRRQLQALRGAEPVADGQGFRFNLRGRTVRLADIT